MRARIGVAPFKEFVYATPIAEKGGRLVERMNMSRTDYQGPRSRRDDWQVLRLAEPVEGAPHDPATVRPGRQSHRAAEVWLAQRVLAARRAGESACGSPATNVRKR
jgi:hypothetical protein